MAKARSRIAARKVKDKWKSKGWYKILSPALFGNKPIAETLADAPHKLINRVTEISLQDLTDDFRKSHIKLFFKINKVDGTDAQTYFSGHTLTSDYIRRMIRRRKSRIDGVYDVITKNGAKVRIKPFATTDKRIQNSQKQAVRKAMKEAVIEEAKKKTFSELIKGILDGTLGSEIYKNCKTYYPVRRVEIYKSEVLSLPTVAEKEKKTIEEPEKKEKKTTKAKKEKKTEEVKEPEIKGEEKPTEEKSEEPKEELKEKKPEKKAKGEEKKEEKKPAAKKTTKKTTKAKTTTKKKTTAKKKPSKKK
ncbi:ribosomal protein S3AE [Thermoplasmatales archaeon SCGC AB-539-N05]|nr:ribosomal protein S3AE [Thermoplasmatales archaeon SCGC AB-539-N05]